MSVVEGTYFGQDVDAVGDGIAAVVLRPVRFVKDLFDAGLVRQVARVKGTVVEKDDDAIVQWCLRRPIAAE